MDFPVYEVHVRRDAMTTTVATVPKHEIEILQLVFGVENVHNGRYERLDMAGLGAPVGIFLQEGDEMVRLENKYGAETVHKVYPNPRHLEMAFEKPRTPKTPKTPKTRAAPSAETRAETRAKALSGDK